jgi:hypothetical protein
MGHGKVEALNRFIRSAFLAELAGASSIQTLDALNEAFTAWADYEYNRRPHSEIGETPLQRWQKGLDKVTAYRNFHPRFSPPGQVSETGSGSVKLHQVGNLVEDADYVNRTPLPTDAPLRHVAVR